MAGSWGPARNQAYPERGRKCKETKKRNQQRRGITSGFQHVVFPVGPSKPLVLRKRGFCRMLSTWNTKSHSPQEVGQECSVVRNGEMEIKFCGEESSTFPLGTEKRAEVRRGHLAESNHVFLHISWSGPSSPSDSSRQPGLSQELASERVGRYSYTSCCALRPMAPPNEHPKTTRGRGRGRSFALRITLSIQFNWVVSVMTFQTLNRASFLQSAVLLKKKKWQQSKGRNQGVKGEEEAGTMEIESAGWFPWGLPVPRTS